MLRARSTSTISVAASLCCLLLACGGPELSTPMPADLAVPRDLVITPCTNQVLDGDETDVDCGGGSCAPCAAGKACGKGADCMSRICTNQVCDPASCMDKVGNGDETDVDCGGSCKPCGTGKKCVRGADCTSGICSNNVCQISPCMNTQLDGMETDVDCGGRDCDKCADGLKCLADDDCKSAVCLDGKCQPALNCMPPNLNCDGMYKSGCNVKTDTDAMNCGSCGNRCPQNAPRCGAGMCTSALCPNGVAFAKDVDYAVATRIIHVEAADLNGDGRRDLVVSEGALMNAGFYVLYNKGGGAFGMPQLSALMQPAPYQFVLGDVDKDNDLDIVAYIGNSASLGVYINQGGGMFAEPVIIEFINGFRGMAMVDVDRDGWLDIVAVDQGHGQAVNVYLNDRAGKFLTIDRTVGVCPFALAVGDLDGDGSPDVVTSCSGAFSVLLNVNGKFPAHTETQLPAKLGLSAQLADMNGDGKLDVVTAADQGGKVLGITVGMGGGKFGATTQVMTSVVPAGILVADFNVDGKPDIAPGGNAISVFVNKGGLVFAESPKFTPTMGSGPAAVADLDGDKKPDVVVATESSVGVMLNTCF